MKGLLLWMRAEGFPGILAPGFKHALPGAISCVRWSSVWPGHQYTERARVDLGLEKRF